MRSLPFMKRKNGIQFAGVGLETGGGGGGGGGGSSISITSTPTKIGKYYNDDLYVVEISITEDIDTSKYTYQRTDLHIDKIISMKQVYDLYNTASSSVVGKYNDTAFDYQNQIIANVNVSYGTDSESDFFTISVRNLQSNFEVHDIKIYLLFTLKEV